MPLFTGTQACIFTELLEGRTLRQTLEDERLAISRAVDIAAQVADGLAAAHRHGDEPGTVPDSLAQYQGPLPVVLGCWSRDHAHPRSRSERRDLWNIDLETGARTRVTFDPGHDQYAVLSPDERVVAWDMISVLVGLAMMTAFAAAVVAAWSLVPLLGLALFRNTRRVSGLGMRAVGWVLGLASWVVAAIAIHTGLGTTDLLVGLGLTVITAGVTHAAGWHSRGLLGSLLPMGVLLLVRQSDFSPHQLFIWVLWVAAVLPLDYAGTRVSTSASAASRESAG